MRVYASLLFALIFSFGTSLAAEEQTVRIYKYADPRQMGRAPDRSSILSVDLEKFAAGTTVALQTPVSTAYLMRAEVVEQLQSLTASTGKGETPRLTAERLGPLTFRIIFPHLNIKNVYRFDPPDPRLESVVSAYYSNVYWREIVMGEYSNHYTVTVIEAVDLFNPRGSVDYTEALLAAALIASKTQPLWGIHDGLGLLEGLGYALAEVKNRVVHESYNYRPYSTNASQMQEFVLRLLNSKRELSQEVHTIINSLVQFEEDDRFLLPEELIDEGEGGCLEFALAYYDLLRRVGCEVKILALSPEADYADELPCNYVTVYRNEEFGPWGYIHYSGYESADFETWEEIPGHIFRDSVYYYPVDPEESMRERSVSLPPRDIWPVSTY
ncbi:hypothetical protein [Marispirochaeta sp.]|uniref:hypothetical protein n=1 Tax=Marispirochaeta sp. TaxID=2038653 RepID=UPI0029C843C2|nr:hypothetical protein [Marispirochaeta sp.]